MDRSYQEIPFVKESVESACKLYEMMMSAHVHEVANNIQGDCERKAKEGEELIKQLTGTDVYSQSPDLQEQVTLMTRAVEYYRELATMAPLIKAGYMGWLNGTKAYISKCEEE